MLNVSENAKETKQLLQTGNIFVDGRQIKNEKFGVGLLDIITIPKIEKFYHIINAGKKLKPTEIEKTNSKDKLCKVTHKHYIKGGKVQLTLHDGRSIVVEKKDDKYSVGDSIVIEIPSQKITDSLKIEKGATCYVALGKHVGHVAKLVELEEKPFGTPTDAVLESEKGDKFITRKDYLFVVPKTFKV